MISLLVGKESMSRFPLKAGYSNTATGFIGGFIGKFITDTLTEEEIETRFVQVKKILASMSRLKQTKKQKSPDWSKCGTGLVRRIESYFV